MKTQEEIEAWIQEGEGLLANLQWSSLSFAMGFAIGKWWAMRPSNRKE